MIDKFDYRGKSYGVGTKVIIRTRWRGEIEATFVGWYPNVEFVSEKENWIAGANDHYFGVNPEKYIVKIIEPVYYEPPQPIVTKQNIFTSTGSGNWQNYEDIQWGLVIYIAVMLVATIFKCNWIIWILATLTFFSWKAKK